MALASWVVARPRGWAAKWSIPRRSCSSFALSTAPAASASRDRVCHEGHEGHVGKEASLFLHELEASLQLVDLLLEPGGLPRGGLGGSISLGLHGGEP